MLQTLWVTKMGFWSILNFCSEKNREIGHYTAKFETKFKNSTELQLPVVKVMQIGSLSLSLSNEERLLGKVTALKNMDAEKLTWVSEN